MKGDLHPAALRLSCSLPVHEHHAAERSVQTVGFKPGTAPEVNRGKGGNQGRKLLLNGKEYATMNEARLHCGVSYRTMYNYIAKGKARYL